MFAMLFVLCAVSPGEALCTAAGPDAVKIGGEMGRRLQVTVENNLLVIDLDKDFLAPFLSRSEQSGYIGLGKTIDAFVRFAAYTGDDRVIRRKKEVVDRLLQSQEPDGYLGIMRPESRTTSLWDVHEQAYLVLGLTADYAFCAERPSLEGARRLADYMVAKLTAEPAPKVGPDDLSAIMGTTGLAQAFLLLAEQTRDAKYRDFVIQVDKIPAWRMPLVLGRWGKIEGHAYAYMARCLAQLQLYPGMRDESLFGPTRDVFDFLMNKDGLVITGTCGDHECWHDTQSGTTNLGETCATAYLLRLYDELLRLTGRPLFGDLMERAVFNALFGAQSPDGRRIRYYTPFETPRVYHDTDTYCCPCNYRRILAELPGMVCYGRDSGIYVNLYTPSTVTLKVNGELPVTLRQETDYPYGGKVDIILEMAQPAAFPLFLRIPRWNTARSVTVNSEPIASEPPAERLLRIQREWKSGDAVRIAFDMPWRLVKGRRTQEGRAAIMRGPILFSYNPKRNPDLAKCEPRLITLDPGTIEGPFPDDAVHPGGISCSARVWAPGEWYPRAGTRPVVLTEYADPDATSTYFLIPNPHDPRLVDDELAHMEPNEF